nr:MAG TPA: hypothetical protein [Caudoviricetes sp.]
MEVLEVLTIIYANHSYWRLSGKRELHFTGTRVIVH